MEYFESSKVNPDISVKLYFINDINSFNGNYEYILQMLWDQYGRSMEKKDFVLQPHIICKKINSDPRLCLRGKGLRFRLKQRGEY